MAEEPLPAGGACLLGSLNLSEFVLNPFTENAEFDYTALINAVYQGVYALNIVLEKGMSRHPLKEQRDAVNDWRQIGLGTMGLADALIKLGIKYGSIEAVNFVEYTYREIAKAAILYSEGLAEAKGAYSKCNAKSIINSEFIHTIFNNCSNKTYEYMEKVGLRNSQILTCAPTGSIGTMLQTSTGIEPNFAFSYNRRTVSLNNEETIYKVDAKIVEDYKKVTGNTELPDYFIASENIAPIDRIKMQAAAQKYIDGAISSTINLPETATVEDVYNIYVEAWKHGLKGITVYRNNCSRPGILTTNPAEIPTTKAPKRPKELPCDIYQIKVKGNPFIVCVGILNDKPYEVFVFNSVNCPVLSENKGVITKKSKGVYELKSKDLCLNNLLDTNITIEEKAATLYASMLLRHGIDLKYIIKTAKKANHNIASFSSAMCRVLSKYVAVEKVGKCPECGGNLVHEGGCIHCDMCEYSKCE